MFITYMYTLPAEVMPTLQAHRACEHTVLAQDAGNFHDLEKLLKCRNVTLFTADIWENQLIFRKFKLDSQSKSAKGNPTESKFTFILALPVWGRGEEEGSTPSPGWFGALTLFKKHVDVTRGLLMKKVRKLT